MKWLDELRGWRSQFKQLERELERKKQRLEALEAAPAPREDAIAVLHAEVDAFAGAFGRHLARHAAEVFACSPFVNASAPTDPTGERPKFALLSHRYANDPTSVDSRLLVGLLAEPLKKAIRDAIESAECWPAECGPPRAEREREMTRLAKEIAELEQQIETARHEADRLGVSL